MASPSGQFDFRPQDEDVLALLAAMRDNDLGWIADEIESAIRTGNLVPYDYKDLKTRRRKRGYQLVPFTAEEQLHVTFETIRRYIVELYDMWVDSQERLRSILEEPRLIIRLEDEDNDHLQEPFELGYVQKRDSVQRLLIELPHP